MSRRGPGRPSDPDARRRGPEERLRLLSDEDERIRAAAARAGMPVATWAREVLLAEAPPTGRITGQVRDYLCWSGLERTARQAGVRPDSVQRCATRHAVRAQADKVDAVSTNRATDPETEE